MLRLLIMRHAKSSWDDGSPNDHERTLAPRGVRAAATMGRFLSATDNVPDQVISSTAVRARRTVELAAEAGGWTCPTSCVRDFYGADPHSVLDLLSARGEASKILVAGHEPTWSGLVAVLTGGGRVRMPTAAVACVDFGCDQWSLVAPGNGELRWLVTPKLLDRFSADP
jgi:phosphohistidine phosphatase